MSIELKVPEVGESISEVEIGRWLKAEGDAVDKDEKLVEIETDKVTVELPAPAAGVLAEILVASGGSAAVGDVIGRLQPVSGKASKGPVQSSSAAGSKSKGSGRAGDGSKTPSGRAVGQGGKAPDVASETAGEVVVPASSAAGRPSGDPRVMPAARRLLEEAGLAASQVEGSGPGGRVLKEDVQRHLERESTTTAADSAPAGGHPASAEREEEIVPMSSLRRRVAQRLVEAQSTAAILTTFNEIDMTAVVQLRRQWKEPFLERYEVKLGFMSFFVKAVVEALKAVPEINAEIRGTDIVYRNYYDIGVAVGGGKGLVVPVIRSAERLSFAELETTIADFGRRAASNELTIEELKGGTFTVSNGGVYGSLLSTPILNPPQSGILGLHAIQDRPVAREGQVVVRPMMYVALSYDHRIVDGREAVTFLRRVKETVEDPARILLEV